MNDLARNPKQIGSIIRRIRKQRAISQSELAVAAGVRQETISLIENDHPGARIETLLAILAVLGLEFHVASRKHDNQPYY